MNPIFLSETECWQEIPGYEGLYEASSLGQIRTKEGKLTYTERHGKRLWKSRTLKGRGSNPQTGFRVSLWKDGLPKDFLVGRLVAITFLGKPESGFTVNHKNGNRFDNRVDNLEWLSLADNIRHAFDTGLMPTLKEIRMTDGKQVLSFRSYSEASRFLGRNVGYVSSCLKLNKAIVATDTSVWLQLDR